ncbi:MAG TPA: aconitate hydratase [Casimicrobiaceae bacterium]|nr:aconitate hydratase [Casimicrobiaceae bacterium]
MTPDRFATLMELRLPSGTQGRYHALVALEEAGIGKVSRLPMSLRVVLESVVRNCDGITVTEQHVRQVAGWSAKAERVDEIPFIVARVVLQDFTGVPLLADLAAMRSAAAALGRDAKMIEPLVPVDLVVDHSVMVDYYGSPEALDLNMRLEFKRNAERYQFMKWGMQAFDTFRVVPPGIGIVHQVNLEYLARGVHQRDGVWFPDSLVGTDSHTTMINGIGVVGWGVGGIEAEAAMLGQPVYILTPDVIGVEMKGRLPEGATATDLVLTVTEMLRREKVVGKFVEFFGDGAASLSVPDRATIGNMSPEYGATMGFFPVDAATVDYLRSTGRTAAELEAFEAYYKAQRMFGMPRAGEIDYTRTLTLDLATVKPSVAGPKRPQDRIDLPALGRRFAELYSGPMSQNGFGLPAAKLRERVTTAPTRAGRGEIDDASLDLHENGLARDVVEMEANRPTPNHVTQPAPRPVEIGNGDVLIAAITSCTNTSNPSVLLAAGLLAKKAVEKGLTVRQHVKTSLAPGSRVVTDYLTRTGLLPYLEKLGFNVAAYGCTTCIGNAGDLAPEINEAVTTNDLVCAAVLSGNRNFEARIHPNLKANFLMSPPLVVAYAIAGSVMKDLTTEPLGDGRDGPVYLRDVWPSSKEVTALLDSARDPATFRRLYGGLADANPMWKTIEGSTGQVYDWPSSTYIAKPPFFAGFSMTPPGVADVRGARVLGVFGDSLTTDHISPAGSIKPTSPAGLYLQERDVSIANFNSYGARRGNHEVMMRGTFANVRIKNLMLPAKDDGTRVEGGLTLHYSGGARAPERMPIYDAAMEYMKRGVPTVIFGGEEYGTGSSRDWAAKGTLLLGVRAVIAKSFERIHRSNLVGMGVLPLQFNAGEDAETLGIRGDETFDLAIPADIRPQQDLTLVMTRADGSRSDITLRCRIDTPIEVDYYRHGGILPYVLRELMRKAA